jgi:hypothetical protein
MSCPIANFICCEELNISILSSRTCFDFVTLISIRAFGISQEDSQSQIDWRIGPKFAPQQGSHSRVISIRLVLLDKGKISPICSDRCDKRKNVKGMGEDRKNCEKTGKFL